MRRVVVIANTIFVLNYSSLDFAEVFLWRKKTNSMK